MHLHLIVVVIPMIAFCSAAFAHTRADFEPRVRLIVEVPEQHAGGEVYLAGNLNDWNPADPRYRLRPAREQKAREYFFELPLSAIPIGGLEFKFTKGSWETVERNADLQDISNRTLDRDSIPRPQDGTVSEIRLAVAAFADERAGPSTIVGRLESFEFTSNILGNARTVRVWLPEAYATETDRAFSVLYMHDGQNCFDEATSAFGDEWRIDETLTELIDSGEIEPMIVVGIDNSGVARAAEYNASYTSFRGIQPYGEKYIAMLVDELMPEIQSKYRVRTGPEHTSLGGSSFGGNITLLAAMERPGVFGRLLIESPAVPVVGPKFLEAIQQFGEGSRWTPETDDFVGRVFMAMGTKETGNASYNQRLVELMDELREAFAGENHLIVVEEGAIHNERAWARRFPDAARFLFGQPEAGE